MRSISCVGCGQSYQVKDDLLGRIVKCRCGQTMRLVAPAPQVTLPPEVEPLPRTRAAAPLVPQIISTQSRARPARPTIIERLGTAWKNQPQVKQSWAAGFALVAIVAMAWIGFSQQKPEEIATEPEAAQVNEPAESVERLSSQLQPRRSNRGLGMTLQEFRERTPEEDWIVSSETASMRGIVRSIYSRHSNLAIISVGFPEVTEITVLWVIDSDLAQRAPEQLLLQFVGNSFMLGSWSQEFDAKEIHAAMSIVLQWYINAVMDEVRFGPNAESAQRAIASTPKCEVRRGNELLSLQMAIQTSDGPSIMMTISTDFDRAKEYDSIEDWVFLHRLD